MGQCLFINFVANTQVTVKTNLLFFIRNQLHGVNQIDMADFADILVLTEGFHEGIMEVLGLLHVFFQNMLILHNIQHGQSDGAANGVACIGVAVHELLALVIVVIEGIVNLIGGANYGHGQVTAGKRLTDAHNIGGDTSMVAGKHFAGTAKAGSDFVSN